MKRFLCLGLYLGLSACMDYEFEGHKDDQSHPLDSDTDLDTNGDTDIPPDTEEICNGVDDNGDGEIDEGFSDLDNDGVADCVDDSCDVEVSTASDLAISEDCGGSLEVVDPWDVQTEWRWSAEGGYAADSYITPLVANLTDTNGDGHIDVHDTPNIVMLTMDYPDLYDGVLWVLSGDSGDVIWKKTGILPLATPVVADLNGDGLPDIAAHNPDGCLTLLSASGATQWTTTDCGTDVFLRTAAADLYGDGTPEIVTSAGIYEGATGIQTATFPADSYIVHTSPTIGDIDLDGEQEIVLGNKVFGPDGTVEWVTGQAGKVGHWSFILNSDSDPEGEVAMVADGELVLYEHDGKVQLSSTPGGLEPSPPCAADFDGDGQIEIAWASNTVLYVYDLDGTEVWRTTVEDNSGASGCSGYDVDGDGAYEILYADETTFYLLDGKTGEVRYREDDHLSTTAFEYPVVADVDGDGAAEILFISNHWSGGTGTHGLTVLGHNGDGWAKSGPVWPISDFAVTNVNQDATFPAGIPLYWQDHNVYRARPTVDDFGVDLGVIVRDVCFSGCLPDSQVRVSVQVGNQGGNDAPEDIAVTLYAVAGDTYTPIQTQRIPSVILSGTLLESIVFDIARDAVGPDGLAVRVDDDGSGVGALRECDEGNNEALWTDIPCP